MILCYAKIILHSDNHHNKGAIYIMKRVIKSSVSGNKSMRPQYHGSDNPNLSIDSIEIENRNFSEPGFHCGTYEQAVNRITTKYSKGIFV